MNHQKQYGVPSLSAYSRGCRCDKCRAFNAQQSRDARKKRATGFTGPTCGNPSRGNYINNGCRCDACREINRAHMAAHRERKRRESVRAD